MPPSSQTNRSATTPILPPLSFQRPLIAGSPQTPAARPRALPGDCTGSLLAEVMASELSIPPTPELLHSRSSTDTCPPSLPPSPGRTTLEISSRTSVSPPVIGSQPVNALGLSNRRRFKGEHLNLKTKESTSPSTLSPRSAFLSPFLSPALTPCTSLLERMSSIITRAPSPSFSVDHSDTMSASAKLASMRTVDTDSDPFRARVEPDDPPVPSFWSEESESSAKPADVFDFGAYFEPGPQFDTCMKSRARLRSLRWPPVGSQTLVHQFSIPVRYNVIAQRPSSPGNWTVRQRKRERRATHIHSAQLYSSSGVAPSYVYVREGLFYGGRLREVPPPLPSSRAQPADILSQKPKTNITVLEKNKVRQIDELINLMDADTNTSEIGGDSVYLSLSDILRAY